VTIRAIFVWDGNDVLVYPTLAAAEHGTEVYDDTLMYLSDDGTVLHAAGKDYGVRLTVTTERRPDELRERLLSFLEDPSVGLDPALADDPLSAGQAIVDREWTARRFTWFPWLDRRLNGPAPVQLRDAGAV
jgi:hypothetical protein